jgi:hypothetical protein
MPGRTILHFGAVDYSARVWVNGVFAVDHEGGHTPFSADITALLNDSGPQTITVQVEDDPLDLAKPRGKQDWQPESHGHLVSRGPPAYADGLARTGRPDLCLGAALDPLGREPSRSGLQAEIGGDAAAELALEVRLTCGERVLAHDRYRVVDRDIDRQIALSDPRHRRLSATSCSGAPSGRPCSTSRSGSGRQRADRCVRVVQRRCAP